MPRRNSERKINRPETAAVTAPRVVLLVWRKCPVCGWETEAIEGPDANPLCQRCQSPMERQAVAPADSYEKKDTPKIRSAAGDTRKRARPRR